MPAVARRVDFPSKGSVAVAGTGILPKVSIILVNYNGRAYLDQCLSSLLEQDYPDFGIVVVDNGSADGSIEHVERQFPSIRTVRAGANLGFGCAGNLGAQHATGEYLAFLNPDTTVQPGWLLPLVQALQHDPGLGLVTPKILIRSQPDRINTCGNQVHFTGFPSCRGWMLPADAMNQPEDVCSVSGAAFVVHRSVFEEIGGFDERYFLYGEDNDLSWRAQLADYRCSYVPGAVVYHEYTPRFGPDKYFYLERNRYQTLLKNLRWRTLALLMPALALAEVVAWGYALLRGWGHVRAKCGVYRWLLAHWGELLEARRDVQERRIALDRDILRRCSYALAYELASDSPVTKLAKALFDPLFFVWYRASLAVIRW